MRTRNVVFALPFFVACAGSEPAASPPTSASTIVAAPTNSAAAMPPPSVPTAVVDANAPKPCGPLDCLAFSDAKAAFSHVLATHPRVLAIGETHAQKGRSSAPSSTKRFAEDFLALVAPTSKNLVLELWVADGACGKQEKVVATQQQAVTAPQAESNQNEFVSLANAAEKAGLRVHVLRPTCDEYTLIAKAGDDAVLKMLDMITRLSERKVSALLDASPPDEMLIAYGGAMHNDLAPPPERAAWSFGPALAQKTQDRYVELDLIVPEAIGDSPTWKAMPWMPHYDPAQLGDAAVLFTPRPGSYTLIFPTTK